MIDPQHVKNITDAFTPEYASFVRSEFADKAAQQLGRKNNFSSEQTAELRDGIILYLLLVFDHDQLSTFLTERCGLTQDDADILTYAVEQMLPEGYSALHASARFALSNPIPKPTNSGTSDSTLLADIAAAEADISSAPAAPPSNQVTPIQPATSFPNIPKPSQATNPTGNVPKPAGRAPVTPEPTPTTPTIPQPPTPTIPQAEQTYTSTQSALIQEGKKRQGN
jgi:hypothetical protein